MSYGVSYQKVINLFFKKRNENGRLLWLSRFVKDLFFVYCGANSEQRKGLSIVYSGAEYARHVMRFGNSLNELFMALGNGEKPNRLRHDHLEKRFVIGT